MPTTIHSALERYLSSKNLSRGTREESFVTLRKWENWGRKTPIEKLTRKEMRELLDHVYQRAVEEGGRNPARTANMVRENLRAVLSWAWEQELIEALPRFPHPRPQRDVAGRHHLTKSEPNALYFATYRMQRPIRGREVLALRTGSVLQFRPRHRDDLQALHFA